MEFAHEKLCFLESRKSSRFPRACSIENYHNFNSRAKGISSLITVSSYAGEYSADNAWDFKELEDAITKNYF